jgi:hypothetical protein
MPGPGKKHERRHNDAATIKARPHPILGDCQLFRRLCKVCPEVLIAISFCFFVSASLRLCVYSPNTNIEDNDEDEEEEEPLIHVTM